MKKEVIIYTVSEVAEMLHTSPNLIYDLIATGKLEAIKVGSLKIYRDTLIQFIETYNGYDVSDPKHIMPLRGVVYE